VGADRRARPTALRSPPQQPRRIVAVPKERIRRKDLKSPDRLVVATAQATAWLQQRRTQVTWVGIVLAAVVVAFVLNASFRRAREHDANADLGRALGAIRGRDFPRAARELKDAAERWKPSLPGQLAAALAASAQLRSGDAQAAIGAVQSALSEAPDLPPYLQQQVQYAWAMALENQGQSKDAAERYAAAAALDGPYRALAVLGEARMQEQLGDSSRARELYRRYLEEFPDMPDRELIEPKLKS
jgi:tetratricopeptide (TPR) repeat protein